MPGVAGAAARARRPRVDHRGARPHAREGAPRAALRRAGLRRSLVLAVREALDAFMARRSSTSPARCACASSRVGASSSGARRPGPLRLRPRHLRRRRRLPAPGLRGLRAPVGPVGGDLGAEQGGPRSDDPLARPVRRGPADELLALHREPVVRPAPRGRRPRRVARTCGMLGTPGCSPEDEAAVPRRSTGSSASSPTDVRFGPTDEDIHTAIERGSPSSRATPAPSCTPAAAATTRWPPTCGCSAARRRRRRSPARAAGGAGRLAPRLADDVYCPATRTSSARSRCCSRTTSSRTSGRSRATSNVGRRLRAADVSPLGAGALAGSSLPIDPDHWPPSSASAAFGEQLDAVSDRDFVAEALFVLALISRCTSPASARRSCCGRRGVRLPDARRRLQHRLVDAAAEEEPRHRRAGARQAGRLIGDLTGFLATLKGLPLAYNRDLQEDKEPLFDALDQLGSLPVRSADCSRRRSFVTERMQAAPTTPSAATDLAEWLVEQGRAVPRGARVSARWSAVGSAACGSTSWCSPSPTSVRTSLARARGGGRAAHDPRRRRCRHRWRPSSTPRARLAEQARWLGPLPE